MGSIDKALGIKTNRAAKRRTEAAERASLIAKLGMAPETAGERYAATTGELDRWLREEKAAAARVKRDALAPRSDSEP